LPGAQPDSRFEWNCLSWFLGNLTSSLFLEVPSEAAVYDRVIDYLLSVAISEENSLRLVAEMAASSR